LLQLFTVDLVDDRVGPGLFLFGHSTDKAGHFGYLHGPGVDEISFFRQKLAISFFVKMSVFTKLIQCWEEEKIENLSLARQKIANFSLRGTIKFFTIKIFYCPNGYELAYELFFPDVAAYWNDPIKQNFLTSRFEFLYYMYICDLVWTCLYTIYNVLPLGTC
jgi:hypothetical protein